MCLEIHRKRIRVVVAKESAIRECWSKETDLDQQGVEIQRMRKNRQREGGERER